MRSGLILSVILTGGLAIADATAQSGLGELISSPIGERRPTFSYEPMTYFNADVADQDTRLHMVWHDFRLAVPVLREESHDLTITGRVSAMDVDTEALLGTNWGQFERFPDNPLWDLRVGAQYRQRLDNGWTFGMGGEFGSASDRPFSSPEEYIGNLTAFLRVPHAEQTAWMFFLNYNSNRSFLPHVPLPGFGYEIRDERRFQALLGVPLTQVRWRPVERLSLEGLFIVPRRVHARVGWRLIDQLELYAGFNWSHRRWLRHDRDDYEERLFYYEKSVLGGVRWDIGEHVRLDFGAGYAFDRFFFEGENFDDRHESRFNVGDGPVLRLQLEARI